MHVSVLIPALNAEETLGAALKSVAQQDISDVEVLVIDDGSQDQTREIALALGAGLFSTKGGEGPAAARNLGLRHARGNWISVLDADDRFLPGRLSKLIALAESEAADIIADNLWVQAVDDASEFYLHIDERLDDRAERISLERFFAENLMFGEHPALGYLKPIFRRSMLERAGLTYPEGLRIGEDFAFIVELMALGARFIRSKSAGYVYARHASSTSHRIGLSQISAMIRFDEEFLRDRGHSLGLAERAALRAHYEALLRARDYVAGLEQAKRGERFAALRLLASRPSCWPLLREPIMNRLSCLRARS